MLGKNLRGVRQFVAENPAFTEDSLRWHIRHAEKNGLDRALIRIGQRVYIDPEAFDRWLESCRMNGDSSGPKAA